MDNKINKHLKMLLSVVTITFGLVSVYILIYRIFPYIKDTGLMLLGALSPFILALIVAILIDPVVNYLENRIRLPRSIAVAFSLLFVLGLISFILVFVSSRLIIELIELSKTLPSFNNYLIDEGWRLIKDIRAFISDNPLPVEVQESVQENLADIVETLKNILAKSTEILIGSLATLPLIFTIVIVAAVATFFISKDKELITNYLINIIPAKIVLPLSKIFSTISSALTGFLRAQLILITMTAIQTVIGLYLLGVDYALTIGVLTGIFDLVPILGPGSVFIPWSLWNIIIGNHKFGFALLILYGILTIVRQLLEPKIVADNIGLHPLATLMAIFIGLRLMGIAGILVGPLVLLIFKAALEVKNK